MDVSDIASLDFETCSTVDLKKTGASVYAEALSTMVICGSYQLPGDKVRTWTWQDPVPKDLIEWVSLGGKISGWNVTFEWLIWNKVLKRREATGERVPVLSPRQLVDTMAVAAVNGLPLSLDKAGQALPQLGIVKNKQGHGTMLRMSRPRKVHADGTIDWWHEQDPDKLRGLLLYNRQDVRVERAILAHLPAMSNNERAVWEMDFEVVNRGIMLDRDLTGKMRKIADREQARLDGEMAGITGGAVPTCTAVAKLLKWAQKIEPKISSLAKDQLARWIRDLETRSRSVHENLLYRALLVRQEAARSSVAKLDAMENYACRDGRLRGLTQYYGAFRTGRWGGRGPQIQNFPRSEVKDQVALVSYIKKRGHDLEGFEILFGVDPLTALASALRGCLTVAEGKFFAALDFSQIEARVLPWLAGQGDLLRAFRNGEDIYRIAAAGIYGVPVEDVDGWQRQIGKVAVLALGYQGGAGAFQSMAKVYGLELPEHEADLIKSDWRTANPKIVRFWWDLDEAAVEAVRAPGSVTSVSNNGVRVAFWVGPFDGHLYLRLPSSRRLVYREARLGTNAFGRDCVTYMGMNQYTQKWERTETYGGKLAENVTQATARDVMASAKLRMHLNRLRILGSVHDEVLLELDRREDFSRAKGLMTQVPAWARGLPIEADGYVGERFRKG